LKLVEWVIAPTSLLFALAYHFGREFSFGRASYLGLDVSLYDFSAQEYVVRSLDPLFVPLGALLLVGLGGLAAHRVVDRRASDPRERNLITRLALVLRVVGAVLLVLGLVRVFTRFSVGLPFWVLPLCPGAGLVLLFYGTHLRRRLGRSATDTSASWSWTVTRALVMGFVVLSLFWATTDYARALGRGRSETVTANLTALPAVTVYSKADLSIAGPSIVRTDISSPGSVYRFRYDGLRLMIRSGDKLFLIPEGWTRTKGAVLVLPEGSGLRFEFHP
jgi:hypothetical protein